MKTPVGPFQKEDSCSVPRANEVSPGMLVWPRDWQKGLAFFMLTPGTNDTGEQSEKNKHRIVSCWMWTSRRYRNGTFMFSVFLGTQA